MKKLIIGIIVDFTVVILSILIFKEQSFLFCGLGIVILGIIFYYYLNYKRQ